MNERPGPVGVLYVAAKRHEQQEAQLLDLYDRAYDLIEEEGEIVCLTSEQTDGPWIISITQEEAKEERKIITRIYIECKSLSKEVPPKYDKCTSVYCEWRSEKEGQSSPWNRLAELKVLGEDGVIEGHAFEIVRREFSEEEMLVDYSKEITSVVSVMSEFLKAPKTSD